MCFYYCMTREHYFTITATRSAFDRELHIIKIIIIEQHSAQTLTLYEYTVSETFVLLHYDYVA